MTLSMGTPFEIKKVPNEYLDSRTGFFIHIATPVLGISSGISSRLGDRNAGLVPSVALRRLSICSDIGRGGINIPHISLIAVDAEVTPAAGSCTDVVRWRGMMFTCETGKQYDDSGRQTVDTKGAFSFCGRVDWSGALNVNSRL